MARLGLGRAHEGPETIDRNDLSNNLQANIHDFLFYIQTIRQIIKPQSNSVFYSPPDIKGLLISVLVNMASLTSFYEMLECSTSNKSSSIF